MNMIFVLVVSAILCAAATFLAISLVSNRSATAPTPVPVAESEVLVDGLLVTLDTDPALAVYIPGEGFAPAAPEAQFLITPFPEVTLEPSPFFVVTDTPAAVAPAAPVVPSGNPVIFISYVVQPGDTLYGIAAAQNSSIELMALHGIDDDDLIPGNVLNLPIANPAYCPGNRAYVVRDKDTVFRIAVQFNTTAEHIRAMNNLGADYAVQVTQVICVPG